MASACNDRIELILGDITRLEVDAIVNAANQSLLGGGGVDGAIHRAAGPDLLEECRKLNGCRTGEAKITGGHQLRAKYVIHTVGPVWGGGTRGEAALLASCYRTSLALAAERQLQSVAFPAISCGVYGYPWRDAAMIAVREVCAFLKENPEPQKVIFCCFDHEMFEIYQGTLADADAGRI
ncbi:O-acetyl-ADP-ribose deacetylase [Candidatus Sumerlaeota bacterium]|nr:O-acetyl-ADP-ribose deacetylase [Candidatus Sumerlaeota bacterium]